MRTPRIQTGASLPAGDLPLKGEHGEPLGVLWRDGLSLENLVCLAPELADFVRKASVMRKGEDFARIRHEAGWLIKRLDDR